MKIPKITLILTLIAFGVAIFMLPNQISNPRVNGSIIEPNRTNLIKEVIANSLNRKYKSLDGMDIYYNEDGEKEYLKYIKNKVNSDKDGAVLINSLRREKDNYSSVEINYIEFAEGLEPNLINAIFVRRNHGDEWHDIQSNKGIEIICMQDNKLFDPPLKYLLASGRGGCGFDSIDSAIKNTHCESNDVNVITYSQIIDKDLKMITRDLQSVERIKNEIPCTVEVYIEKSTQDSIYYGHVKYNVSMEFPYAAIVNNNESFTIYPGVEEKVFAMFESLLPSNFEFRDNLLNIIYEE